MGFSKPSVSRAVSLLKQGEFITVDREGFLYLTEAGRDVAEKIYERHTVLTQLLISIGVDPEIAEADACRVEHDISDETFSKIKEHVRRA